MAIKISIKKGTFVVSILPYCNLLYSIFLFFLLKFSCCDYKRKGKDLPLFMVCQ